MISRFSEHEFAVRYAEKVDQAPFNALYERPATLGLLREVAGQHVLDAGCGSGWYTEQLLARGARVTAIDASDTLVGLAKARIEQSTPDGQRVEFRVASLSEPLTFLGDGSVDAILSALVLHYVRDWQPTLSEFRRVLKPTGWLLFSTHHPCTEAARFHIKQYFATETVDDHWDWIGSVRFYRRPLTAIFEALSDAGFLVERVVEPLPTDAFRDALPAEFDRIAERPDFVAIRAVPRQSQVRSS